jgi:hypothetical protein
VTFRSCTSFQSFCIHELCRQIYSVGSPKLRLRVRYTRAKIMALSDQVASRSGGPGRDSLRLTQAASPEPALIAHSREREHAGKAADTRT